MQSHQGWFMFDNMHFPYPGYQRPLCPKCNRMMMLSLFDRKKSEPGKRTFECVSCNHFEASAMQYLDNARSATSY
jgi:hypothetical protein